MIRVIPAGCATAAKHAVSGPVFVRDIARDPVLFECPAMVRETNRALYASQPMAQT